jgi:hypothetical protein
MLTEPMITALAATKAAWENSADFQSQEIDTIEYGYGTQEHWRNSNL